MRYAQALFLITVITLAACGRKSQPAAPAPLGPVPIEARVFYDNGGGVRDSGQIVIREAATLRDVWQRATSTQSSPPPLPTVDFSKQMLIMVAGGRMSPDNQIHVDSVGRRRERNLDGKDQEVLTVAYTITEGCRKFNRDAYPVEIVRIRRYDGQIRFNGRRERATSCQ